MAQFQHSADLTVTPRPNEDSGRLRLHGVGHLKVRLHRPTKGTPKTITVRREERWFW